MAWKEIGRSALTPISNKTRKEVLVDIEKYVFTVGFEVNYIDTAFKDNIQILSGPGTDYGHAFFYVTKNDKVVAFLSFGPNESGKVGWFNKGQDKESANWGTVLKDGYLNARPGTPDYKISEVTRLFRVKLTTAQAKKIIVETEKLRARIKSGDQLYTVYINDTCAETAKQILDAAELNTPDAEGKVKINGATLPFKSVNPYMWHHNFKKAGHAEIVYPQTMLEKNVNLDVTNNIKPLIVESDNIHLLSNSDPKKSSHWLLYANQKDPLVVKGYVNASVK